MSPSDDFISSLHESSHGCFAALRGMSVKEIVLHKIGARADEQGHTTLYDTDRERDGDPLGYATYLLIAGAAERRATGTISARCSHDYEIARLLCSVNLNKDVASPEVASDMAAVEALASACVQDERFWGWVQATSVALVRKRRLTGQDHLAELREGRR